MNHSAKAYSVLICLISALATPALAEPPTTQSDSNANSALGSYALWNVEPDEGGCHNTASGYTTLFSLTTGSYNTASGVSALYTIVTGNNNTAMGYNSLYYDTADNNTAIGYQSMYMTTSGTNNAALGYESLYTNTTGNYNTASGYQALYSTKTAAQNTATGAFALHANTGSFNTAAGFNALYHNTTGTHNVAMGYEAGYNETTGSNNIEIGSPGTASDNNTIQIGVQGTQTSTSIAGIFNAMATGGMAVYVTGTGLLGTAPSSERFKTDIAPMPELSDKLQQLRPVIFHYKTDPQSVRQYGLIAEEVEKVYPELVVRDDKGRIQGVRYEELAPMLLNEIQKQNAEIAQLKEQQKAYADMQRQLAELQAAVANLQPKDQLVARGN